MGLIGLAQSSDATPMDPNEIEGLIPRYITLKRELDEYEQTNILIAQAAVEKRVDKDMLSEAYVRKLHKMMFNKTWQWAGKFRTTEKSIGVEPSLISVCLRDLLDDVKYWKKFNTYSVEEQAVRLHHRLVLIHPFPNGNGRHARLYTDAFLRFCGVQPFSWGRISLINTSETRRAYIAALRAADKKNYDPLLAFVHT